MRTPGAAGSGGWKGAGQMGPDKIVDGGMVAFQRDGGSALPS
ncbi:hypothetical protein ARTHRO9AX_180556 [Arthrobacter sp. 9AX]|nr:hypothetical protein ARTHRO9AX_180556 [Arthrobacter sp. 9AX]